MGLCTRDVDAHPGVSDAQLASHMLLHAVPRDLHGGGLVPRIACLLKVHTTRLHPASSTEATRMNSSYGESSQPITTAHCLPANVPWPAQCPQVAIPCSAMEAHHQAHLRPSGFCQSLALIQHGESTQRQTGLPSNAGCIVCKCGAQQMTRLHKIQKSHVSLPQVVGLQCSSTID